MNVAYGGLIYNMRQYYRTIGKERNYYYIIFVDDKQICSLLLSCMNNVYRNWACDQGSPIYDVLGQYKGLDWLW